MGRKTVAILIAAPLQYSLITVKVVALEMSVLVRHKILRLLAKILAVNDKHYLLNNHNLPQPIQMQLYQIKQKTFSEFFV